MRSLNVGQLLGRNKYQEVMRSDQWKEFASGQCRDAGACAICHRSDIELHCHHINYNEADPLLVDETIVLCKYCHNAMHEELKRFRKLVFRNLTPKSFRPLNDALAAGFSQYKAMELAYAMKAFVAWPNGVERFFNDWLNQNPDLRKDVFETKAHP